MQSVVALQKRPTFRCSAQVTYSENGSLLRIEICTMTGDVSTRQVRVIKHLGQVHTVQETQPHYKCLGVNVRFPEWRVQCTCCDAFLGISKHERGFSLRDNPYLSNVYYSAKRLRTILQESIDACPAYHSVARALRQALVWVDAHK